MKVSISKDQFITVIHFLIIKSLQTLPGQLVAFAVLAAFIQLRQYHLYCLESRLDYELDKAHLRLGYVDCLSVEELTHRHVEYLLLVPLSEELGNYLERSGLTQLPWLGGVTNICDVQADFQHQLFVSTLQLDVFSLEMPFEPP